MAAKHRDPFAPYPRVSDMGFNDGGWTPPKGLPIPVPKIGHFICLLLYFLFLENASREAHAQVSPKGLVRIALRSVVFWYLNVKNLKHKSDKT